MLSSSRHLRCIGKELYSKGASALPKEYFSSCTNHFGIVLHEPLFIGVRGSQVRGLYLSLDHPRGVPANKPLFTIPLRNALTIPNLQKHRFAQKDITVDQVRDCVTSDEFRIMTPLFYIGMQVASIISHLPDFRKAMSEEEFMQSQQLMTGDLIPWARMLDDEDFNEMFIFGMYGMALDSWQRASFQELNKEFHKNITNIHTTLKLPYSVDLLRRITRLVIARAEQIPLTSNYDGPLWLRRLRRLYRWVRKDIQLPTEPGVLPLLDLVNHSNRPNVRLSIAPSKFVGGAPAVTVSSLCAILPGQEICRHYNFAMTRPNALFRYGFLPFDLISVVEHDAVDEHLIKAQDQFKPEEDVLVEQRKKEMNEIQRLENIFRAARSTKAKPPGGADNNKKE